GTPSTPATAHSTCGHNADGAEWTYTTPRVTMLIGASLCRVSPSPTSSTGRTNCIGGYIMPHPPHYHQSPGALVVSGHRSAGRGGRPAVAVEAAPALASQQPRLDHPQQERRRVVQRLLELLIHRLRDRLDGVQADQVGQLQRSHWMCAPQHHAVVDVLGRGEPGVQHPYRG